MIKSSLIKFTTSLNIYIAGLKRPQERGNALTALLVHSEGRIFRRRLVCNLKGEEMPGRKRAAKEFEKLVKSEVKSEVCTEAGVSIESIVKSVIYLTESQGFYCEFCEAYIMNPIMFLAAPAVLYLPLLSEASTPTQEVLLLSALAFSLVYRSSFPSRHIHLRLCYK